MFPDPQLAPPLSPQVQRVHAIQQIKDACRAKILERYSDSDQRAMAARVGRIVLTGEGKESAQALLDAHDWIADRVAQCRADVAALDWADLDGAP